MVLGPTESGATGRRRTRGSRCFRRGAARCRGCGGWRARQGSGGGDRAGPQARDPGAFRRTGPAPVAISASSVLGAPCATMRVSMTIMINPTIARRALTARTITADFESPRSNDKMGAAAGLANASAASRTALCSSGPIELSLSHSTSPASSCNETAWVRLGSTAARTFWQTASKSTSGLSDCIKGLPCSIDPLHKVNTRISTVPALSLM